MVHRVVAVVETDVWRHTKGAKYLKEIMSDLSYDGSFVFALIQVDEILTLIEQVEEVLAHDLVRSKMFVCYTTYLMNRIASCHFYSEFVQICITNLSSEIDENEVV